VPETCRELKNRINKSIKSGASSWFCAKNIARCTGNKTLKASCTVCSQVQSIDMPVGALYLPRPPFSTVSHDLYYFLCCRSIRCGSHPALTRRSASETCVEKVNVCLCPDKFEGQKLQRMMFPSVRIHMHSHYCIVQLKCDGSRRRTVGEVKGN
jgi:hypothetical protein